MKPLHPGAEPVQRFLAANPGHQWRRSATRDAVFCATCQMTVTGEDIWRRDALGPEHLREAECGKAVA